MKYLPTTFVFERLRDKWIIVHSQRSAHFQTIQQLMNVAQKREESVGQDIK